MNNVFANLAANRVALIQTTMTTVIGAEQAILLPILKALLILFIARQFLLVHFGQLSMDRFWSSIVRALIIVFLCHGVGNFNTYVVQKLFVAMPAALSNMGVGSYAPGTAGQTSAAQFDTATAAGDAIAWQIIAQTQLTSPTTWFNSGIAAAGDWYFRCILSCIFGIWILGISLLGIGLCLLQPFLIFELFERTRGFLDQIIGKLVGFLAYGFACSIVLAMEMQSLQTLLAAVNGVAGQNAATAAQDFLAVLSNATLDFLAMLACPLAFGFGSGAVAGLAVSYAAGARGLMVATRVGAGAVRQGAGAASRAISRS
jgi:hypothetical protein